MLAKKEITINIKQKQAGVFANQHSQYGNFHQASESHNTPIKDHESKRSDAAISPAMSSV